MDMENTPYLDQFAVPVQFEIASIIGSFKSPEPPISRVKTVEVVHYKVIQSTEQ